jgi:predicted ArsR family transcriptional regulator
MSTKLSVTATEYAEALGLAKRTAGTHLKNFVELGLVESVVEQAALAWLEAWQYDVLSGPEIAPGEAAAEGKIMGRPFLSGD